MLGPPLFHQVCRCNASAITKPWCKCYFPADVAFVGVLQRWAATTIPNRSTTRCSIRSQTDGFASYVEELKRWQDGYGSEDTALFMLTTYSRRLEVFTIQVYANFNGPLCGCDQWRVVSTESSRGLRQCFWKKGYSNITMPAAMTYHFLRSLWIYFIYRLLCPTSLICFMNNIFLLWLDWECHCHCLYSIILSQSKCFILFQTGKALCSRSRIWKIRFIIVYKKTSLHWLAHIPQDQLMVMVCVCLMIMLKHLCEIKMWFLLSK